MTLEDILKKEIATGVMIGALATSIFATKPNSKIITPSHHIITNSKQIELPKPGQLFAYNFPTNYDIEEQKAAEIMANIALRRINPSNEWSRVNTRIFAVNQIADEFNLFRGVQYYKDVDTGLTMFKVYVPPGDFGNSDDWFKKDMTSKSNKPIIAEDYLANPAIGTAKDYDGSGTPPWFGKEWMRNTLNLMKWKYVNYTNDGFWGEGMDELLYPAWDAVQAEMYNFPGPVNPLMGTYFVALAQDYYWGKIFREKNTGNYQFTVENVSPKSIDDIINHLESIENKSDLYAANPNINIGLAQMDTFYIDTIRDNLYKDSDGNWQTISNSKKEELTQEYISKLEQNIQKAYDKMMDYANNPNNPFRKYVRDKWGDEGVIIEAYQMLKAFQYLLSEYEYAIPVEERLKLMKKYEEKATSTMLKNFPKIAEKHKYIISGFWFDTFDEYKNIIEDIKNNVANVEVHKLANIYEIWIKHRSTKGYNKVYFNYK